MRSLTGPLRILAVASTIGLLGVSGAAVAQDATPPAGVEPVEVVLQDVDGNEVGTAVFNASDSGVEISIAVEGLEPGDHGVHIHETGTCDPGDGDGPFSSAGGHFNPTGASHGPGPQGHMMATPGIDPMMEMHAGDLGNITVENDGSGALMIATDLVTLAPDAETSLSDADGSALVIHEGADDLMTDPSGDSGGRIACGVIFAPMDGTPAAADEDVENDVASGGDEATYRPGDEPIQALNRLAYSPTMIVVSPGDTIEIINIGVLEHDFVVDDLGIGENLPNGKVVEIQIPEDAEPGEYMFYCSIPGHRAAGMVGTLIVEGD
jgi:superoxide dismutase, Cu-Zn family